MSNLATFFRMDDISWERHANPWSVWTRLPILPLLCLVIWNRHAIGLWTFALIAGLAIWAWVNPRIFPRPAVTESWASRAVMGERVWLARKAKPIPAHHALWAGILSIAPVIGLLPLAWGMLWLEIWPALFGLAVILGAKLWFLDRMAWLYDDMARQDPEYASWHRQRR